MSYVLRSFQIGVVFLCFGSFLSGMQEDIPSNSKNKYDSEVRQESQLCNLPVHVLHHIAHYLYKLRPIRHEGNLISYTYWWDINTLTSTCKYLDRTVTAPDKTIKIGSCNKKRKENQSCGDLLSCVYNLLMRIVRRGGNNPIYLYLPAKELAEDMSAFELFIRKCITFKCAAGSIVDQLTSLELGLNGFTELPGDITRLHALKYLGIGENPLNSAVIEQICTMTFLENLDLDNCDLDGLPDSFKNLNQLRVLKVQGNLLTKKDLGLIQNLSNLKELHIGPTGVTFADVLRTAANLPKIRLINLERNMELGETDLKLEELFAALPSTVEVWG